MTAKEFLKDKTLEAVEIVDSLILNLVVEGVSYGLKVDTSSIKAGTPLIKTTNFSIDVDVLVSGNLSVDLAKTDMLLLDKVSEEPSQKEVKS